MNFLRPAFTALALILAGTTALVAQSPAPAAAPAPAKPRVSPHETISIVLDADRHADKRVTITYGRPFSRDPKTGETRKIWGNLVKWDKADRLGADEATLLLTQQPLQFGDTVIPAGAYTLYIVPSETGVTKLAFSTNLGKWGIPVDETHDLARVDLKKESLATTVDQLTFALGYDKTTGAGLLKIMWENTQFSVPLTIKK